MAGPPYFTDDPVPVDYRRFELYLASQYRHNDEGHEATLPHVELNYGALPDLQLHVIAPFVFIKDEETKVRRYGYGDTELGFKYRFIHETDWIPQIGIFPLAEIPSGNSRKGLGHGSAQYFLPLWLQKSRGRITGYGGGGYWFNSGGENIDYWVAGWQVQVEIVRGWAMGGELFY